jgi:hypothetical protein
MPDQQGFQHTLKDKENIVGIAKRHGLPDYDMIYNHEKNAGVREKYPDIFAIPVGTVIWIPKINSKRAVVTYSNKDLLRTANMGVCMNGLDFALFYSPSEQMYYMLKSEGFDEYKKECEELDTKRWSFTCG